MNPALAAIADQSSAPNLPKWLWITIAVIGGAWLIAELLGLGEAPAAQRTIPTDVSNLLQGRTCALRCGLAGTIVRREHLEVGGEYVAVCPGHNDEGVRKGWWSA